MKRIWWLLSLTLLTNVAFVQVRDDFNGGYDPAIGWHWFVPSNNPACTGPEPDAVSFSPTSLDIAMRDGALYQTFNNIHNIPNVRLVGTQPTDWYIETALKIDWSQIGVFNYVQAGILLFTDAANYFQLLITRDATGQTETINGSTNVETNDGFAWGERVTNTWAPDSDYVGLRIAHDSSDSTIKLYFRRSTDPDWVLFDGFNGGVYPSDGWQYPIIQGLINSGQGRVGLYTDNAGGGYVNVWSVDYFETNLNVARAADIDSSGCVDDADLAALIFTFGNTDTCMDEDTNNDGVVDDADLAIAIFDFGTGC